MRPSLPQEYSASWEEEMISDYSFAKAADALLEEGRVDEALQLTRRGVAAHSLYAAGHIVLARVHIAQKSWEAACEPLERALKLDGPTPALLEMLAMCYDETGQIDLALECRSLGCDHDIRPLTEEEHEGGPEMVEERTDDLEPGDEIVDQPDEPGADIVQELDDLGSPEDALKELEALLDGSGSSKEGDEDGNDLEETSEESEELDVTDDGAGEESDGEDTSKDDIWKKIMEQADAVEKTGYSGVEDLESLISESETETGVEPASEPESEAEPVADLESEAEPVADLESEAEPIADLESEAEPVAGLESEAEPVAGLESEAEPVAGLESEAEPVEEVELTSDLESVQPENEERVETTADATNLEPEEALPVEDTGDEEQEVSSVEGLETGSSDDVLEDMPYSAVSEGEGELPGEENGKIASILGEEGMVTGPVELSEESIKEAAEGLELDSLFDAGKSEEAATDEAAADTTEPSSDVEAALRALESDLDMQPDETSVIDQPDTMDMEDDSIGLEEIALDEIAMEETEAAEEEEEDGKAEGEGEEALPYVADAEPEEVLTEGGVTQIKDAEDSIKLAIQAEILVGKGHVTEAIRLLEALHLWEPDRASYKERLEALRRLQE